jgi:stage II sporulation protein D
MGQIMLKRIFIFSLSIFMLPVFMTLTINKVQKRDDTLYKSGRWIVIENQNYKIKMDIENFIPCVLMAQLGDDAPIEMAKAQAAVIRTYIMYKMGNDNSISADVLGLPFVTYGKMQQTWFEKAKVENANTGWGLFYNFTTLGKTKVYEEKIEYFNKIIEKTEGYVLKKNGKLIVPLYHKISNGSTRDGTKLLGDEYSYLKKVKCKTDMASDGYLSVKYYTPKEIVEQLKNNGIVIYEGGKEKYSSVDYNENNKTSTPNYTSNNASNDKSSEKNESTQKNNSTQKNDSIDQLNDVNNFLKEMDCSAKDESGYQLWIKIGDTKIKGESFAEAMDLKSTSMNIEEYERGIRISTTGEGHGFGMSLEYAKELACQGEKWQDILRTFYDCLIVREN